MPTTDELIHADYRHRGVIWTPPNGRKLRIVPADRSNFSKPSDGGYRLPSSGGRLHLGACIHTPEEDADDNEVTPRWFRSPKANASTHAYGDNDGDLYAMVPFDFIAWAQGTHTKRWQDAGGTWHKPTDRFVAENRMPPDWFPRDSGGGRLNNNVFLDSIEVEGRAATMNKSFVVEGPQWDTLASWLGWLQFKFGWQDEARMQAHGWLSTWRSDPGKFVIDLFPKIFKASTTYRQHFEVQAQRIEAGAAPSKPATRTPAAPTPPPTAPTQIEVVTVEQFDALKQRVNVQGETLTRLRAALNG